MKNHAYLDFHFESRSGSVCLNWLLNPKCVFSRCIQLLIYNLWIPLGSSLCQPNSARQLLKTCALQVKTTHLALQNQASRQPRQQHRAQKYWNILIIPNSKKLNPATNFSQQKFIRRKCGKKELLRILLKKNALKFARQISFRGRILSLNRLWHFAIPDSIA